MNEAERNQVGCFLYLLEKLVVDDDGLVPGANDAGVLKCLKMLVGAVQWVSLPAATPEHVLLYQLACATERLLAGDDVVKRWLAARGELLGCQLSALR